MNCRAWPRSCLRNEIQQRSTLVMSCAPRFSTGLPGSQRTFLNCSIFDGDEVYYLDLANLRSDGEAPVVCRFSDAVELQVIAPSFAAFLEREV